MSTMASSVSERGRSDALPAPQPHRVFGSHPQRAVPSRNALPFIRCAARLRLLLLPPANLSLRSCVRQGEALQVLVPPLAVPQKSRSATSQPWRTSDTSPFALHRKVKPQKNASFLFQIKKGTNPL